MNIQAVILLLCACALAAFLINRKKKLPKAVFLFFSVAIIVSVFFYALGLGGGDEVDVGKADVPVKPVIFFPAAADISVSPGETRFALPVAVSGERVYDCIRFVLESEDASVTEQSFLDKVRFSLLFSDGSLIPASSIIFSGEEDTAFPKHFVLKVFFVYPASVSGTEIRCVVENGLNAGLRAAEISVGSLPASRSDD